MIRAAVLFALLLLGSVPAFPGPEEKEAEKVPDALMLRYPDVSRDSIAFVYAGDIWVVPKSGGLATRLTSAGGDEILPRFSPGGEVIAFSGNYDGNIDIYTIPREGGIPERLTHHPDDDIVVDWYPGGKNILFHSNMLSPSQRYDRLFKVSAKGGLPEALPLPYGELGSLSPDGKKLAFEYMPPMRGAWRGYRGGMASDIWIYDFETGSVEKITDYPGTDSVPMWRGKNIFFVSDRGDEKRINIWAYNTETHETRRVTDFKEFDVKWPSLGPDDIVFENGGRLFLLSLPDETVSEVVVHVPDDLPELRTRLKDLTENISDFSISPTGKRALFGARGEVLTVPAGEGRVKNLTNTSGVAERFPVWSPDGKYVAYLSDRSGEYELYYRLSNGDGGETRVTEDGSVYRYRPVWSRDSKKIAFSDKTGRLFVVGIDDGKPKQIDKDAHNIIGNYSWSPDSKYVAYTKVGSNKMRSVYIYDVAAGKSKRVTRGFYNDNSPVFDPEGKYLYYFSDSSFTPVYGDMDDTWIYPNSSQLYAITLAKDTASPLAPVDEEEYVPPGKEKKEEEKGAIDFEGMGSRAVKLPVGAGNFGRVTAANGKVVYLRFPAAGSAGDNPGGSLQYFDFGDKREKTVMQNVSDYDLSADGSKIIYRSGDTYGIVNLSEGSKPGDGQLALSGLKASIDPREEWGQIFADAWRIERDFFYDPGMHGVDWNAVRARYEKLLPFITDREDLNYVIGEMVGELNSSHTYVGGGDVDDEEILPFGLPGAEFELEAGSKVYKIKKIYTGGKLNPDAYSPLGQPGLGVEEGDYIIAVNGRKPDVTKDPWEAFAAPTGDVVTLTVAKNPNGKDAREVNIKLISTTEDRRLRYLEWVEANLEKVDKMTGGRVGYVYVPDTGWQGQNELVRQFVPQADKEALVIDERFNGGGQVPDRFIELLNRPVLNYWATRDFKDSKTPSVSNNGPKVMIINGWSGSGGDAFPYYFRKTGIGPLVGTRTLGGLIGIGGNPGLIDGGYVTAPSYAFWNSDGKWEVEGYGVEPDYVVEDLPENINDSPDPQLEKAVDVVLELLEDNPPRKPQRPLYEDRAGSGKSRTPPGL